MARQLGLLPVAAISTATRETTATRFELGGHATS
jgi:hypothetical protein